MAALSNPFDVLPGNLFNLLSSQAGGLQRHYMAILLRVYALAEFNRFGLTREIVVAEIVDYLTGDGADALAEPVTDSSSDDEPGGPPVGDAQEYASWILRRLVDAGWLEREQQADYTEFIILPDYAFTLLEALRIIQEQKPREYTGQLYAAHQLLTKDGDDFSPALALTQAYENVRQVVRGLNELNQNIRRYTERVGRNGSTHPPSEQHAPARKTTLAGSAKGAGEGDAGELAAGRRVAELLRLQYDDYAQVLGPAYHALKTSDHISRYRRDITARLQDWQLDEGWLNCTADELATQGRLTPAQAAAEINHYMRFIVNQLESLDPLLGEIDRRHAQYLRTSLRQIRYQLVSADGSFKDRLISLGRELAALQTRGGEWLPDEVPPFQAPWIRQPNADSLYTLPRRRAPFAPAPIVSPVLDPADVRALRAVTLQELGQAVTPARIQSFVGQFFNGHRAVHVRDLPPQAFEKEEDLPWLIFTIAYGNHPEVDYELEPLPGDPVALGLVRVRPFQLVKK